MSGENEKKIKGFSLIKLALFLLIVILITGVALYSFLGINPLGIVEGGFVELYNRIFTISTKELSETVKRLASYDINESLSCAVVEDDLFVCSPSSLKCYDFEGREKAYFDMSLKKPFIKSCKKDILVADIGGRYMSLISDNKVMWEKNTDEDIVNASLSEDFILIITKSKQSGYKRTIRVYSRAGDEVSFRNVSNYYPFCAFHYPEFNKSSFIVCGIEAASLATNGLFEFLDPTMNQKASIRGEKEVLLGGLPIEKETLLIYGEKSLVLVDKDINTLWEKKYSGSKITTASVLQDKYPVVAELNTDLLSRQKMEETYVTVFNIDGSEKIKLVIDSKVTGLSCMDKTIAALAGSEVYFINTSGEIIDRYTAKTEVSEVYLVKDDMAYLVCQGDISRIKIKGVKRVLGIF